jgi:hypothetical protein
MSPAEPPCLSPPFSAPYLTSAVSQQDAAAEPPAEPARPGPTKRDKPAAAAPRAADKKAAAAAPPPKAQAGIASFFKKQPANAAP